MSPLARRTPSWPWCLSALLCVYLALPLRALDPERKIWQYGRDHWNQQLGLPGGAVSPILQSRDGYLWLVSAGYLFRFDGVRFAPISLEVDGKPVPETVRAACMGQDGSILIRTMTRFLRLEGGRFSDAYPPTPLPSGLDMTLHQDRSGLIWVGSDNHLYRCTSGGIGQIIRSMGPVRSMAQDAEGNLWIAAAAALYRFKDERLTRYPIHALNLQEDIHLPFETDHGKWMLPDRPVALLVDRQGTLWVGTSGGLCKIRDRKLVEDPTTQAMQGKAIRCLLEDRDGNLWVGTDGSGLFRLTHGQWSQLTAQDGLSDNSIQHLFEDREGSLWISSQSDLDRLRNTPLITLTTKDGLSNNNVSCVLEARDGSLYVFTQGGGITCFQQGRATVFTMKDGLLWHSAGNLYEAKNGTLWAGMSHGMASIRQGRVQPFTGGGRLSNVYVSAVCEDDEGLLVTSSDQCIFRLKENRLTPFELKLTPSNTPESRARYVFSMQCDSEGTRWFAMSAGVYRLAKGMAPEKAERTAFTDLAQSMLDDHRGYLWISGRNTQGFARLDKHTGALVRFPPPQDTKMSQVARLQSDASGNLWVPTNNGLYFFRRTDLDAFAEGRITTLPSRKYDALDGMITEECGGNAHEPSSWAGLSGKFYFASRKGLVVFDPSKADVNQQPPPVQLEEVRVDGKPMGLLETLTIQPGYENLEFHYSALSFRIPSRVRFKYRMEGLDTNWIEAGTRRTAYYTRIPPGHYRFQVLACNDDGVWNALGASVALTLRPRFHQTPWFILCLGLIAAGLGVGVYKLRTRHLRRRHHELVQEVDAATRNLKHHQEHLEQMVQERTYQLQREVEERQKAEEHLRQSQKLESIGRLAGGVAHDFNNLLTVINGYSDLMQLELEHPGMEHLKECSDQIRKAGERAAGLTRQLLAFSRKQVLQPEIVDLNMLIADMEKMLSRLLPASIRLMVTPDETPCWVLVDPGQMGQIILNLAVNARDAMPTGGSLILETTHVDLGAESLESRPDVVPGPYIALIVSDTGTGMDPETQTRIFEPFFTTKESGKGTGLGLATVFGIVKQSGGHIWLYSEVGKGTAFKLYFPQAAVQEKFPDSEVSVASLPVGEATILVVEDQESVRGLVVRTLTQARYHVLEAPNAEAALSAAWSFEGRIDLLFTDVMMPGMNGRELAERIQQFRPELKVVFTSGYTETLVVNQGVLESGITLLQKPFSPRQLVDCIQGKLATSSNS